LGLEIRLDYSWFLIFFFLSWTLGSGIFPAAYHLPQPLSAVLGVTASLLLFASVLVHEMGHALVAKWQGTEVDGITLFLFGGVAQIKSEPESPRAEFLIAVVGPFVSFAIGLGFLGLWMLLGGPFAFLLGESRQALAAIANYLGVINVVLALFNLIPGFPLDGGRILRSALWAGTKDLLKATRWASFIGQVCAWGFIAKGLSDVILGGHFSGFWMVFLGWFLNSSAASAYQQLVVRRALWNVPVSQVLQAEEGPAVDGDLRIPEFVESYLLKDPRPYYPVFRHGDFLGLVSAEDVAQLERNLWGVTCVAALARCPAEDAAVDENLNAWAALTQMLESDAPRLLVLHNGKAEGVVTRDSILKLVQRRLGRRLSR
jgi:Zn-dependent protease